MLRLIAELWLPALLVVEVALPLARGCRTFPICRGFARIATAVARLGASDRLRDPARARLASARRRNEAALIDHQAAQLERESQELEDETNNIRQGEE